MRWAGLVARMGETSFEYRTVVGTPEGKKPRQRSRRRWQHCIILKWIWRKQDTMKTGFTFDSIKGRGVSWREDYETAIMLDSLHCMMHIFNVVDVLGIDFTPIFVWLVVICNMFLSSIWQWQESNREAVEECFATRLPLVLGYKITSADVQRVPGLIPTAAAKRKISGLVIVFWVVASSACTPAFRRNVLRPFSA